MTDVERRQTDADLSRRMDSQDNLLREIRDMIVGHVAEEKERKAVDAATTRALDELVLLWRASKILVPALMLVATTAWGVYVWAKDHIK